jgi:hypothetical protein
MEFTCAQEAATDTGGFDAGTYVDFVEIESDSYRSRPDRYPKGYKKMIFLYKLIDLTHALHNTIPIWNGGCELSGKCHVNILWALKMYRILKANMAIPKGSCVMVKTGWSNFWDQLSTYSHPIAQKMALTFIKSF